MGALRICLLGCLVVVFGVDLVVGVDLVDEVVFFLLLVVGVGVDLVVGVFFLLLVVVVVVVAVLVMTFFFFLGFVVDGGGCVLMLFWRFWGALFCFGTRCGCCGCLVFRVVFGSSFCGCLVLFCDCLG